MQWIFRQFKELERRVAALREAEGDAEMAEKTCKMRRFDFSD